ncbi:MAG: hypothetical protein IJ839_03425 [Ruminobacter sp.]|jgi:exonuclease VII large subunit|nr:hypothetical protein [Ruminobacter sp.]
MIVAVVGVVGVIAVIGGASHDDHRDHSNHRNYPDSSVRNEIARLEAESKDLERNVERFISSDINSSVEEFLSFIDSNPQLMSMIEDKIDNIEFNEEESLSDVKKKLTKISEVMATELQKEIDSEKQRLESIDETLRRINYIELK